MVHSGNLRLGDAKLVKDSTEGQRGTLSICGPSHASIYINKTEASLTYRLIGGNVEKWGKYLLLHSQVWVSGFESLPYYSPVMRPEAIFLTPLCPHFPICAMGRGTLPHFRKCSEVK